MLRSFLGKFSLYLVTVQVIISISYSYTRMPKPAKVARPTPRLQSLLRDVNDDGKERTRPSTATEAATPTQPREAADASTADAGNRSWCANPRGPDYLKVPTTGPPPVPIPIPFHWGTGAATTAPEPAAVPDSAFGPYTAAAFGVPCAPPPINAAQWELLRYTYTAADAAHLATAASNHARGAALAAALTAEHLAQRAAAVGATDAACRAFRAASIARTLAKPTTPWKQQVADAQRIAEAAFPEPVPRQNFGHTIPADQQQP